MPNALLRLITHPPTVMAHVLGEALRASPLSLGFLVIALRLPRRIHRFPSRKFRRNLDHGLVDQHCHGVQIARIALEPQALRFQRQRATTGKGIMKRRQLFAIKKIFRSWISSVVGTGSSPALPDLVACRLQHLFVGHVLPYHELFDDAKQSLALLVGEHFIQRWFWAGLQDCQVCTFGPFSQRPASSQSLMRAFSSASAFRTSLESPRSTST